ncbi:uncharacterized protein VNE69_10060 [Vairimorpha necatrix]|uniref:Uncharacterized protein n=1 Tax=Vairimorpha necatrix TaxID=6039 RepID=A0AAX4JFD6_9MICR
MNMIFLFITYSTPTNHTSVPSISTLICVLESNLYNLRVNFYNDRELERNNLFIKINKTNMLYNKLKSSLVHGINRLIFLLIKRTEKNKYELVSKIENSINMNNACIENYIKVCNEHLNSIINLKKESFENIELLNRKYSQDVGNIKKELNRLREIKACMRKN